MSFTLTRTTKKPWTYLTTKLNNLIHPTKNFSIFPSVHRTSKPSPTSTTPPTTTTTTTSSTHFHPYHQQQQSAQQKTFSSSQQQQYRKMTSSSTSSEIKPQFSEGSDPAVLGPQLEKLLAASGAGGKWTLTNEGVAIERTFKFKTFAKTWVCDHFICLFVCCVLAIGSSACFFSLFLLLRVLNYMSMKVPAEQTNKQTPQRV